MSSLNLLVLFVWTEQTYSLNVLRHSSSVKGGRSTNRIGKVLMDSVYRGCIMPRVKKAK